MRRWWILLPLIIIGIWVNFKESDRRMILGIPDFYLCHPILDKRSSRWYWRLTLYSECLILRIKSQKPIRLSSRISESLLVRRRLLPFSLCCERWQSTFTKLIVNLLRQPFIISFLFCFLVGIVSITALLPSIRIGKDDNKVTNLIHLFCCHLANSCTPEENAVITTSVLWCYRSLLSC